MDTLLGQPFELQIALLAGYVGYKISTIGRPVTHRTEDFLLQVLAFGAVGRLAAAAVVQALIVWRGPGGAFSGNANLLLVGCVTVLVSAAGAAWWRASLQGVWSRWMGKAGVYRDDHQPSVWASIMNVKTEWQRVLIHCDDGQVYESNFEDLPSGLPMTNVTLSEDGLAVYVTRVYCGDNTERDINPLTENHGATVNYFPRSTIKRVEIMWKRR